MPDLDTLVTYTSRVKSKSPVKACFSDTDTFSNLNLANAELTSIILSNMSIKKKIARIIDLDNVDIKYKVKALISLKIPESNVAEYLDLDTCESYI
jgi:hypothetical protein